jgi:hypothetical protein
MAFSLKKYFLANLLFDKEQFGYLPILIFYKRNFFFLLSLYIHINPCSVILLICFVIHMWYYYMNLYLLHKKYF